MSIINRRISFRFTSLCIGGLFLYFVLRSEDMYFQGVSGIISLAKEDKIRNAETEAPTEFLPFIYVITPTYDRLVQKADLTRLMNTLLHVPNLHWIVIEDSDNKTEKVKNLLASSGIVYTHLSMRTEAQTKPHKGISQRNKGLKWIVDNKNQVKKPSVFYFADDDNAYSLQIFEEMRYTKKVSVWPVGFVGGMAYGGPILENNTVRRWRAVFHPKRPFAVDMAGFAVNTQLLFDNPNLGFLPSTVPGHLETDFIKQLNITLKDLEPKADKCTKVLVWHTKTGRPSRANEKSDILKDFPPVLEV